jgi:malonyl-CoA O-methyltransferase
MTDSDFMLVDKKQMRGAFQRAAASYDAAAVLQREIADRLLARLALIKLVPARILDAGCGTGYCTRALAQRYPRAQVLGLDIATAMTARAQNINGPRSPLARWRRRDRYVCGDAESLPLASASVDMVFSNLAMQWCDPQVVFAEFLRVLRPGGLLMFTSFGPDTLRELRNAWATVDDTPHVHGFIDMHDLGDALMRTQFAEPVMDMEHITLTYADVLSVMRDLKAIGAHNVARGRSTGLLGKQRYGRFVAAYESRRLTSGRIPATYEVVYGHAWAPLADSGRGAASTDGSVRIPVARIGRRGRA